MKQGAPIIYQAVLWDAHNMNYGSPDFLVRSDVLRDLFPESISEQAGGRHPRPVWNPMAGTTLWWTQSLRHCT